MLLSAEAGSIDSLIKLSTNLVQIGNQKSSMATANSIISPEVREKITLELLDKIGPIALTFLILLIFSQLALWRLYEGRLKDRQREIDRMAVDNKEKQNMINQLISDLREKE